MIIMYYGFWNQPVMKIKNHGTFQVFSSINHGSMCKYEVTNPAGERGEERRYRNRKRKEVLINSK
jgi:hypothetical protein